MQTDRPSNPYVGPRPFEREHKQQFFGRDQEVRDLLSLVTAKRFVLLYAASGAGKTSLLNAGLVPVLEEDGFVILPSARVRGASGLDLPATSIPNIYVFNTLLSWAGDEMDPRPLLNLTLSDLFRVQSTPESREAGAEVEHVPRVLIFDQFEELFTTYLERWEDRKGFIEQLRDALAVDPYLRVIVAMREDFIAQMDPYTELIPAGLQTSYRIERLDAKAALSAIERPLDGSPFAYEESVADNLAVELRKVRVQLDSGQTIFVVGQYIEPVQLQVVCESILDSVIAANDTVISDKDIERLGGVTEPLVEFYQRAIRRAAQAADISEITLRAWFSNYLITPAGTRGIVYRGETTTGEIPNAAVDSLADAHLIRGQYRAGARWYELAHDRFIGPIQESNARWHEELQARRLKRIRNIALAGSAVLILIAVAFGIQSRRLSNLAAETTIEIEARAQAISDEVIQDVQADATQAIQMVEGTATEAVEIAQSTATEVAEDALATATVQVQIISASTAQAGEAIKLQATTEANEAQATAVAEQVIELVQDIDPLQLARSGVLTNVAWNPTTRNVNGANMVLVPVGCFKMGNEEAEEDERPVHEQCIKQSFWIDETEVSYVAYQRVTGVVPSPGVTPTWPRDVTWSQADDFCQLRGARLPTEVEWEYAARGPDGLLYPWGNEFDPDRIVAINDGGPADVDARPEGASWVGALNMIGNRWEWVSTIMDDYPYDANDGREAAYNADSSSERVLRGGNWLALKAFLNGPNRFSALPTDLRGFRCARNF